MLFIQQFGTGGPSWRARPSVALLRRFSSKHHAPGVCQNDLEDLAILHLASNEVERDTKLPIMFAKPSTTSTSIEATWKGTHFELRADGERLSELDFRGLEDDLGHIDQLLLIAGLDQAHPEVENRAACIATIRSVRGFRPLIYAQFLSWRDAPRVQQDEIVTQ